MRFGSQADIPWTDEHSVKVKLSTLAGVRVGDDPTSPRGFIMLRYGIAGLMIAVVMLMTAKADQDTVTLKAYKLKDGNRIKISRTEKSKGSATVVLAGKTQTKEESGTKNIVYVDEIITAGAGDGRPVKLKRTYEKYDVTRSGKDEAGGPPLNTPILIEKKGEKYQFTINNEPVKLSLAVQLAAEFDQTGPRLEVALLPGKAVKAGETWKVDGAKIASWFGPAGKAVVDADKSVINAKLVKTYQQDQKQFGVLEFDGELVVAAFGQNAAIKVKPGSKIGVKMTVDACIDGTDPAMKIDGTASVKLDAEVFGGPLTLEGGGPFTETRELLKK
jgi:hypothetical protein